MRISVVTDLHIKDYTAGKINVASSYVKNAVYDQYPEGNHYAEQRPGINIFEDASLTVSDAKGRGVYYWNKVGAKYFINNDTVYKDAYSGSSMSISAGSAVVYIFEIGDYLVFLDPENNEGWTIHSSTPTVITQISDSVFTGLTLVRGGAVLNGILYVLTTAGDIYESDIEDPTSWNALNFRNAEISADGGMYLGEHHQHIVVIGNRSLEFFYYAANPTGSTLNPRTDIDFAIGAVDEDSFWEEADLLFWVGFTASGGVSVYSLQNFIPTKISKSEIDTYLGNAVTVNNVSLIGSGFQVGGRIFYVLTLFNLTNGMIVPVQTITYELTSNRWYIWELEHPGIEDCPVIRWTKATETRLGEGIMSNGDLITPTDKPQDTVGAHSVYDTDVYETDVYQGVGQTSHPIEMVIVPGPKDFGSRKRKFQYELWLVATPTTTTQTLRVNTSDEADADWSPSRLLDTSNVNARLRRLGKFRQRNYKLTYQGDEKYRIEGIETIEKTGTA